MDTIAEAYASSDESEIDTNNTTHASIQSKSVMLAPNIDTTTSTQIAKYHDLNTTEILHNPTADVLFGPISGPLRACSKNREQEFKPKTTTLCGYVDIDNVDGVTFTEQYHTYQSFGYAIDPTHSNTNKKYIGDEDNLTENKAMTIFNQSNKMIKNKKSKTKKRLRNDDPADVDGYLGPWAQCYKSKEEEEQYAKDLNKRKEEWKLTEALRAKKVLSESSKKKRKLNDDDEEVADDEESRRERREKERQYTQSIERTEFHGTDEEMYDYQGRSYMHCASERRKRTNSKYYTPKKRIHQYIGHKSGVNAIQFIPGSGHLLLSASNDCTAKIWNVYDDRKCLRTFYGHDKGIRNICFNKAGTRFLSTSYDRWIKCWDTEKGKVIWRGTSGILPFNAKYYPSNESEFICGQKNKIAVQWDIRCSKIVQKYDEHLSAVNDVLFIDNNRRFATSSDDKKIFIWDYGTPVVIKHISEPHLHSTPFLKLHPNRKWFLGQSMDNKIVCYSAANKIGRLNAKKVFEGHLCAGYAIQIDVSYDGNMVMSGDAKGNIYFWDWKTTRFYHKMQCHKKVTIGSIWHPVQTSMVATCSWDATIALWA